MFTKEKRGIPMWTEIFKLLTALVAFLTGQRRPRETEEEVYNLYQHRMFRSTDLYLSVGLPAITLSADEFRNMIFQDYVRTFNNYSI